MLRADQVEAAIGEFSKQIATENISELKEKITADQKKVDELMFQMPYDDNSPETQKMADEAREYVVWIYVRNQRLKELEKLP
jgi:hypothetical protein